MLFDDFSSVRPTECEGVPSFLILFAPPNSEGLEVIWPGVGQTIFLSGPAGTHAAGTSGTPEVRIPTTKATQRLLTNDAKLFPRKRRH